MDDSTDIHGMQPESSVIFSIIFFLQKMLKCSMIPKVSKSRDSEPVPEGITASQLLASLAAFAAKDGDMNLPVRVKTVVGPNLNIQAISLPITDEWENKKPHILLEPSNV